MPAKLWPATVFSTASPLLVAITAMFLFADTAGDDNHCRFRYILENHTDRDYRIQTSALTLSAVRTEKSSLAAAGTGEVKFAEEMIFLPAKDHAEVEIEIPYSFPSGSRPSDSEGLDKYVMLYKST